MDAQRVAQRVAHRVANVALGRAANIRKAAVVWRPDSDIDWYQKRQNIRVFTEVVSKDIINDAKKRVQEEAKALVGALEKAYDDIYKNMTGKFTPFKVRFGKPYDLEKDGHIWVGVLIQTSYPERNLAEILMEAAEKKYIVVAAERLMADRIAKSMVAMTEDKFTVMKPLKLKREGATRDSLVNVQLLKAAGYEVENAVYDYDRNHAVWDLYVEFRRPTDNHQSAHTFKGFSWGYSGEGSRGMMEFSNVFGLGLDEQKVFGQKDSGLSERGTVPLSVFK